MPIVSLVDGRKLQNQQSYRCITVYGSDVRMQNCQGGPFQDWIIEEDGTIRNSGSNSCLYFNNGPANARITLQPCTYNRDGMQWTLVDGVLKNLRYNWCARPNTASNNGICLGSCTTGDIRQNWGEDETEEEKEIVFP
ncbi:uncharacterized protein LOC118435667 [Folsomia candida]|uniref:uncharacterized protein LOC118435667 n=1 Tax=Folsomia candida TaxID=158441 RepID=UPI001604BDAE|nr:uncharacterized protein LOC118435667 [Folsomia candida]